MKLLLLAILISAAPASALPATHVAIGEATLRVEIAHTDAARRLGLMHRQQLAANRGMLFIFPHADRFGMWMKNTLIPLEAAFVSADGTIINIVSMKPNTDVLHHAAAPAQYVIEANRGWFTSRNIRPGMKIHVADPLPQPE